MVIWLLLGVFDRLMPFLRNFLASQALVHLIPSDASLLFLSHNDKSLIFAGNSNHIMSAPAASQPFSNIQLEILKLFADNVADEDLVAIKEMISRYFLEKAKDEADKIWEAKQMDAHNMLKQHRRTPYQRLQP